MSAAERERATSPHVIRGPAETEAAHATALTEAGEPIVADVDASELPDTVFGARDLTWWGTAAFMTFEGVTLVVCAASYFYLWRNVQTWPPPGIRPPSWGLATFGVVLYLLSLLPMVKLSHAARHMDLAGVKRWLLVGSAFAAAFTIVRALEFRTLHVSWATNAYGSLLWVILGLHGTLVAIELAEVVGMTIIMHGDDPEPKHFTDAADIAFYWYFLVGSWLPLYAMVWLLPRWA